MAQKTFDTSSTCTSLYFTFTPQNFRIYLSSLQLALVPKNISQCFTTVQFIFFWSFINIKPTQEILKFVSLMRPNLPKLVIVFQKILTLQHESLLLWVKITQLNLCLCFSCVLFKLISKEFFHGLKIHNLLIISYLGSLCKK